MDRRDPGDPAGRRGTRVLGGVLSLVLLSGCAAFGGNAEPTASEIAELERRVVELQRASRVHEQEIERLRRAVAELEGGATGAPGATAAMRPAPPSEPKIERPAPVEETDLEAVPPPSPRRSPATDAPPVSGPRQTSGGTSATAPVDAAAQATYDQAYTLYHQGRYAEAEARFTEFLAANPETELSDNAQYWVGAARFARGEHAGALEAFRITVERYPEGNKVADALFKIGQCLEEVGEPDEALDIYAELVERYPQTAAASLAAERRARLAAGGEANR